MQNDLLQFAGDSNVTRRSGFYKSFRFHCMAHDSVYKASRVNNSYLVFVLEGSLTVDCGFSRSVNIQDGQLFIIPKYSELELTTPPHSSCSYVICLLSLSDNIAGTFNFVRLSSICKDENNIFGMGQIRPQMQLFLNGLLPYLEANITAEPLLELKQQEMFLMFRYYYTDDELVKLFSPVLGDSLSFRMMILKNYRRVRTVDELVALTEMGRTSFNKVFKREFGVSPRHWMICRTAESISRSLRRPGARISEVMNHYGFNSNSHFTRFCKTHLGYTPSEIMAGEGREVRYSVFGNNHLLAKK